MPAKAKTKDYPESIGEFVSGHGTTLASFTSALSKTNHCARQYLGADVEPVFFEHGNSGASSSTRYGTRVAHLHCIWTRQPDQLTKHLLEHISPRRGWVPIRDWTSLPKLASIAGEYFFLQVAEHRAWACVLSDVHEGARSQQLRRIVHQALVAVGEKLSDHWTWRSTDDLVEATKEAGQLRKAHDESTTPDYDGMA